MTPDAASRSWLGSRLPPQRFPRRATTACSCHQPHLPPLERARLAPPTRRFPEAPPSSSTPSLVLTRSSPQWPGLRTSPSPPSSSLSPDRFHVKLASRRRRLHQCAQKYLQRSSQASQDLVPPPCCAPLLPRRTCHLVQPRHVEPPPQRLCSLAARDDPYHHGLGIDLIAAHSQDLSLPETKASQCVSRLAQFPVGLLTLKRKDRTARPDKSRSPSREPV